MSNKILRIAELWKINILFHRWTLRWLVRMPSWPPRMAVDSRRFWRGCVNLIMSGADVRFRKERRWKERRNHQIGRGQVGNAKQRRDRDGIERRRRVPQWWEEKAHPFAICRRRRVIPPRAALPVSPYGIQTLDRSGPPMSPWPMWKIAGRNIDPSPTEKRLAEGSARAPSTRRPLPPPRRRRGPVRCQRLKQRIC